MSGIVIDVDAKAGSANKELERLNRNLANIVNGSDSSKKALNGLSASNLTNLNNSIKKTTDAFKTVGTTGSASMNRVNADVRTTANSFQSLTAAATKAAAAFAAFGSARYLMTTADALTNVQNRMNLVNGEAQDLVARQRELFVLSQRTRTSYAATANTFVDFARGLEGTGVSAQNTMVALDSLQKAAVLSGSSVDSINAALTQLGQGLASGALRGEELNSVLEQMKYIGPGLARQLGMTLGQMREFAAQGKLTPKLLADALVAMNRQVSADFSRTTATTAQAFTQLRESLAYFFGDISSSLGLSTKFAKIMTDMSDALLFASDNIVTGFNLIKRSISNFIQRYSNKSAFAITVQGALNLDFNPDEVFNQYKQNATIKKTIEDIRETFNVDNLFVEDPSQRKTLLQKFFGIFGATSEALAPVKRALTDITYLRDSVLQLGKLFIGIVDFAGVAVSKVLSVIPLLEYPFKTYITSIKQFFMSAVVDINSGLESVFTPVKRNLEAFAEVLTFYTISDNRLERAWVNLFKSDSLKELTDNLFNLSSVMKSVRRNDFSAVFKDMTSGIRGFISDTETVLIRLNILDNRLFGFGGESLTNFKNLVGSVGSVLARLYDDILEPALSPLVAKTGILLYGIAKTLLDGISDLFSVSTGEALARGFYSGIVSGIAYIKGLFDRVTDVSLIDLILGNNPFAEIQGKLGNAFKGILGFIYGFTSEVGAITKDLFDNLGITDFFKSVGNTVKGVVSSIISIISGIKEALYDAVSGFQLSYKLSFDTTLLEDGINFIIELFKKVYTYASSKLTAVTDVLRDFGETVKDIFFNIYDEVVGHSFWPDTIDGIVDYTKNLFGANKDLSDFKESVIKVFSSIKDTIVAFGENTGGFFGDLVVTIAEIDISQAKALLLDNIQAVVAAGLAVAYGSLPAKIAGYGYFTTLLNDALGGALTEFTPKVMEFLGETAAGIGSHLAKGYLIGLDMIMASIPSFLSGIVSAFIPLGGAIEAIFKFVPGLNNTLIQSIAVVGVAMAAFQKNWTGGITELIFGKPGGKNGKGAKEGLLDYLSVLIPDFLKSSGPGILTRLFGDRKLVAAAAAAAFASINLQSISVFEGLGVGLPLLAFALLGKDGGARLIKDTTAVAGQALMNAAKIAFSFSAKTLGFEKAADTLVTTMADSFKSSSSTKRIQTAFKGLIASVSSIPFNLNLNAEKYASGQMSFADAMFTLPNGKEVQIKKRFNTLMRELGKQSTGKGNLSDYWKDFTRSSEEASSAVRNTLDSFKGSSVFSTAWWSERSNAVKTFFGNASLSATKTKASFAELATTLASSFGGLKFGEITVKLKQGFDKTKTSAVDILNTVINLAAALAGIKTASNLGKVAESLSSSASSMKSTFDLLKSLASGRGGVGQIADMTDTAANIKMLTGSSGAFSKFKTILSGVSFSFTKIGSAVASLIKLLMSGISIAFKFLKPFLKIGAIITAVGALGLWLFGPGNTFRDKLQWAEDKIKGIFGINPEGSVGRTAALDELLKGIRATDTQGNAVDVRREVSRVNTSPEAMATERFDALKASTEEFAQAVKDLDAEVASQGGRESTVQKQRRAELTSEYTDTLRRQSIRPNETLQETVNRIINNVVPDLGFLDVLKELGSGLLTFLGYATLVIPVLKGLDFVLAKFGYSVSQIGSVIADAASSLWSGIKVVASAIWTGIKAIFIGIAAIIAVAAAILLIPVELTVGAIIGFVAAIATIGTALYYLTDWAFPGLLDSVGEFFSDLGTTIKEGLISAGKFFGLFKDKPRDIAQQEQSDAATARRALAASAGLGATDQEALQAELTRLEDLRKSYEDDRVQGVVESEQNYQRRRVEVEARYARERAEALRKINELSAKGENQIKIDAFQNQIKDMSENIKSNLNIDLGDNAIKFGGTLNELNRLNQQASRASELRTQYGRTSEGEQRRQVAVDIALNEQSAKNMSDAIASMITDAAKAAKVEEVLGGAVSQGFVQFVNGSTPDVANAMNGLARQIASKQAELQTATLFDSARIQREIGQLQQSLYGMLDPGKFRFEDINAGFQTLGLEAMNAQAYLAMPRDQLDALAGGIRDAIQAQQAYNDAVRDGTLPWDQINARLQQAINKTNALRGQQAAANADALRQIANTPGLTARGQLYLARQQGLTAAPQAAGKTEASARRAISLSTQFQDATADMYETTSRFNVLTGQTDYTTVFNPEAVNRAAELETRVNSLNESLGEVGKTAEGTKKTFSDLISTLSETGIEVTALGFSRLGEAARRSLRSIGSQLLDITKRINEAPLSADISASLARQTELLNQARTQLIAVLSNTGTGILNSLSEAGITENAIIANMSSAGIDTIIASYAEVITARQALNNATDPRDFVVKMQALIVKERSLNKEASLVNETYASRLSMLNEMLGTSFTGLDFSMMDSNLSEDLVNRARELREELDSINQEGISSTTGRVAQDIYADAEALQRLGSIVEVFRQAGKTLRDSLVQGAEQAYDRIKKTFDNFDITLREFTFFSDADRQALDRQAAQIQALRELSSQQLPAAAADIINSFDGTNLSEVWDGLKGVLGENFSDQFRPPVERLISALDRNTVALGGTVPTVPTAPPIDTSTNTDENGNVITVTAPVTPPTKMVSGQALRNLLDYQARTLQTELSRAAAAMSPREAAGVSVGGNRYFDNQRLLNLANPAQLEAFNTIADKVRGLYAQLNEATRQGLDTSAIQAQIDAYTVELERIPSVIERNANMIAESGKGLAESFDSSVRDGLKGLLKGDMSFGDMIGSIANNITSKLIDNFVDNLMAPLTGEGSGLFGIFENIGKKQAAGASAIGTTIAGQPTTPAAGAEIASGFGSIFKNKKNPVANSISQAAAPVADAVGSFDAGASVVSDAIGTTMPDAANLIGTSCTELGTQVGDLAKAGGAAGGLGGGGMAGLAGMAGSLIGMLIGGLFAGGGQVKGPGTGTSDSILAGVSNGEYIVNAAATKDNLPLLEAINEGLLPKFATGGQVNLTTTPQASTLTAVKVPAGKKDSSTVVNLSITGDISRQTRSQVYQMLPSIAEGVNMHNREKGYR